MAGRQALETALEAGLKAGLAPAAELASVKDVRVLGGIGVIELEEPVNTKVLQPACVERGIWVRPFAHNFYVMPPFVMGEEDLEFLTGNMIGALRETL